MRLTIEIIIGAVIAIAAMGIMLTFMISFLYSEQKDFMIVNPRVEDEQTAPIVVWETKEPANGIIFYRTASSTEEKRVIVSEYIIAHRIELEQGAGNIKIKTCNAVNKCSEHDFTSINE